MDGRHGGPCDAPGANDAGNDHVDHEAGGEIAGSLSALYDYVQTRLIEANLHNDPAALRESLDLLGEIESAWNAIPNEQRQVPAMAAAG